MMEQGMVFFLVLVSFVNIGISTDIQVRQLQFMVEKLQGTVMSFSKKNAEYKKLVEDIVDKFPDFENVENLQIGQLFLPGSYNKYNIRGTKLGKWLCYSRWDGLQEIDDK